MIQGTGEKGKEGAEGAWSEGEGSVRPTDEKKPTGSSEENRRRALSLVLMERRMKGGRTKAGQSAPYKNIPRSDRYHESGFDGLPYKRSRHS